jgi:selenocysteine-specific elongation factor
MPNAPQIVVSSVTGQGIDTASGLAQVQREVVQRSREGGFRLGLIARSAWRARVSWSPARRCRAGGGRRYVDARPSGKPVRVRGLHAQNQVAEVALAGQRVALNISAERLALEQIHRGHWLCAEWLHARPSESISTCVCCPANRAFEHFQPVHVHLGTQDVTGRVALLEGTSLVPGARMFAQLLLNAPVQAVKGDPLILRDQSAQRTLGGGRVLDPFAPDRQRRSPERLAQLRAGHAQ